MIARTSPKTRASARAMEAPSFGRRTAAPAPPTRQQPGNQYLQRLLANRELQAKLTVNKPGDKNEQEADRIADQVMRMPEPASDQVGPEGKAAAPQIQRVCSECEEEVQRQPLEDVEEELQRQPIEEEEELVQSKELPGRTPIVSNSTEQGIQGLQGGGRPLPASSRAFFEPRFGRSFSQVRVHTDSAASSMARSVGARAFTVGNDIVFGSGELAPSFSGHRLLAHELTHVAQQRGTAGEIQRQGDQQEIEASDKDIEESDSKGTENQPDVSPEATTPEEELSLRANVGRKGVNNIDDIHKVQDRLLELGLLSPANYELEYLLRIEKVPLRMVRSLRPETTELKQKEKRLNQRKTVGSAAIRKTIAAIEQFQRLIFKNGWSDGRIDVGGKETTLKRLRQTNSDELTRLKKAFEDRKRKEKIRAQKKRKASFLASAEAQMMRQETARTITKIIERYSHNTYIPGWLSLDETGLGYFLANDATSGYRFVLEVLDLLDDGDKYQFAFEISSGLSAEELMNFDPVLLNRLREELDVGSTLPHERLEIGRIREALEDVKEATLYYEKDIEIRSLRVQPELEAILVNSARATGTTIKIFSGGQPSTGPKRTGSHRHDHGYAADIHLFNDGTLLRTDRAVDTPLIQAFVEKAVDKGATGIGAGPGYMGSIGLHVDIAAGNSIPENEAGFVWGKTKSRDSAPSWLKAVNFP